MSSVALAQPCTYRDLVALPDDGLRHELLDGEHVVVEILSPGTRRRDKGRKRAIYEREGVREYWIVDPAVTEVTTLKRQEGEDGFAVVTTLAQKRGDVLASPLFPGLVIPLARIFG